MIQNKNKLNEVGLEPDKPSGYVRAIWALTLILIFAVIVGAGIYFILWCSPWGEDSGWNRAGKPSETKGWQTYRNEDYELTIKYPEDWSYAEFPINTGLESFITVSFYAQDLSPNIEALKANPATEFVYDVALTLRQGDKKAEYANENTCEKDSDPKIGGVSAELYKCRNQMIDKDSFNYVAVNDNKTYSLLAPEENKDTLDKMAGTISFGAQTVGLKTYKDDYLAFKYPSSWDIKPVPLFGGGLFIDLDLGILNQVESSIGYSLAPYSGAVESLQKDPSLVSLDDVIISGISGKKAIRQGTNYYSYDVVIPIASGVNTFLVHYTAELNAKNKDEVKLGLDDLIKTIELLAK